jgi:hypothetical protein
MRARRQKQDENQSNQASDLNSQMINMSIPATCNHENIPKIIDFFPFGVENSIPFSWNAPSNIAQRMNPFQGQPGERELYWLFHNYSQKIHSEYVYQLF